MDSHCKELLRRIAEYNVKAGAKVQFWESKRVLDYVFTAANEVGYSEIYRKYLEKPIETAKDYWSRFYRRYTELLGTEF